MAFSPFTPPQNDQSLLYLSQLFGDMNGILPATGMTFAGTNVTFGNYSLLIAMFKTFNSAILVVGALIVFYVTVVGILKTAQEGEFLGRNWNSLWIPIRMVLGIAALVPVGTGYSAIQMIMMWVIVQGVGAADTLWSQVIDYVSQTGSPYVQLQIPNVGSAADFQGLFQSLASEMAAAQKSPNPSGIAGGGYFCNSHPKHSFCTSGLPSTNISPDANVNKIAFGPDGDSGTLQYCNEAQACSSGNSSSLSCLACQGQKQALSTIITTLRGVAYKLVQADLQYRNFYYNSYLPSPPGGSNDWNWIYNYCAGQTPPVTQQNCCVPSKSLINACSAGSANFPAPNTGKDEANPNPTTVRNVYWEYNLKKSLGNSDFIQTANNYYTTQIKKTMESYNKSNSGVINSLSQQKQWGWIFAGGLFYTLGAANNATMTSGTPELSASGPDLANNPLNDHRNLIDAAVTLVDVAGTSAQQGSQNNNNQQSSGSNNGNCTPPSGISVSGVVGKIIQPAINTALQTYCFIDSMANPNPNATGGGVKVETGLGSTNPIISLQHIGQSLLAAASTLFFVLVAEVLAIGLTGAISPFAWGFGITNPVTPSAMFAAFLFMPLLFGILGALISVGALLAVYTPLVPYVIFTVGALGWMLSTIEAMIAGPLVALGILSPGGQHDLLGRSEPALGLLFAIFLRPSLMIFGLVAGMLLSSVVVYMVNQIFWSGDIGVVHMIMVGTPGSKAASSFPDGGAGSLLEFLIFLGAYVMLIVTVVNKSFAAIHIIPDRVLSWIGVQGGQGYGFEQEAIQGVQQGGGAVAGGAAGVTGGMQSGTGQMLGENKQDFQRNEADRKAAAQQQVQLKGRGNPPENQG